jgi:hypothetical protein
LFTVAKVRNLFETYPAFSAIQEEKIGVMQKKSDSFCLIPQYKCGKQESATVRELYAEI